MLRYHPELPQRITFPGWAVGAKTRELNELLFRHGMNRAAGLAADHAATSVRRKGDVTSAAQFIDHGANLDARDEDICSTPLGWAAKFNQRPMVELLSPAAPNQTSPTTRPGRADGDERSVAPG